MLVLDRKIQEGFWIDDRIFVKVLSISKRRIKLGIEAPGDLKVVREELRNRANGEAPVDQEPSPTEGDAEAGRSFRAVRRRN
ncbi:MAG: carbon storage regulator [Dehalococcoidia bacterium]